MKRTFKFQVKVLIIAALTSPAQAKEIVSFTSGKIELKGELFKPNGAGPFPVLLFNHGSAPGMLNSMASKAMAPKFVEKGWVFFMPYRRGQGLSTSSGKYVMDEINHSIKKGGLNAGAETLVRLNRTDHLDDQMTALKWIKSQSFVNKKQIAVLGNSFGGIQTMLGIAKGPYCAGVNASGGAQSWSKATSLQKLMINAAKTAKSPVMFFQAENDYDLSPSKTLFRLMKDMKKDAVLKIYPPFGQSPKEGHSFPYRAVDTWFSDVFSFISSRCR